MDHTLSRFFQLVLDHGPKKSQIPIDYDTVTSTFFLTSALYDFLSSEYEKLINHKALKSEVLQAFREIGNAIALTKQLEDAVIMQSNCDKILINDIISYGL